MSKILSSFSNTCIKKSDSFSSITINKQPVIQINMSRKTWLASLAGSKNSIVPSLEIYAITPNKVLTEKTLIPSIEPSTKSIQKLKLSLKIILSTPVKSTEISQIKIPTYHLARYLHYHLLFIKNKFNNRFSTITFVTLINNFLHTFNEDKISSLTNLQKEEHIQTSLIIDQSIDTNSKSTSQDLPPLDSLTNSLKS